MESTTTVHVSHSYPRLFTRQVIELWDYQWNPVRQQYERVCFRPLHLFEDEANPQDPSDGEFFRPNPIMVSELPENVQRRMPDTTRPAAIVPPARPPPPNFGAAGAAIIPVPVSQPAARQAAVIESPASPDPSEPYSPTDTPTKRIPPSPPPFSPNRLHCDRSYFVARQDHQFALPVSCPDNQPVRPAGPFSPANPPLQSAPQPRTPFRRRAPSPPSPPRAIGRGRGGPYPVGRGRPRPSNPLADTRPRGLTPSQQSAFVRARNLFRDFIPNIEPPMVRTFPGPSVQPPRTQTPPEPPRTPSPPEPPRTPSPPLLAVPVSRTPSPDIFLELYQHGRHPIDDRSHLSIIPSWAVKAEKELTGECVICYGEREHLQIRCQNCGTMRVCCICVVGVYQSINPCPMCRYRGEF